jgi:hypothetical protein
MRDRIIFLLIILALLLTIYFLVRQHNDVVQSYKSIIDQKNSEIEFHVNDKGRIVAEKGAAEMRYKDLQRSYPSIYNSIKNDMDIKMKNLRAYIQSEFQASASNNGTITNNYIISSDSTKKQYRVLNVNDGYLKLVSYIGDSSVSPYNYTYADTIKQAISIRRSWFLGREHMYSTATMSNPNSIIRGNTSILIKDYRDKRFGVGIGATYNPFANKVFVGIGIQYNLFKF